MSADNEYRKYHEEKYPEWFGRSAADDLLEDVILEDAKSQFTPEEIEEEIREIEFLAQWNMDEDRKKLLQRVAQREYEKRKNGTSEPFPTGGYVSKEAIHEIHRRMDAGHYDTFPPGYFSVLSDAPDGVGKTITGTLNDLATKGLLKEESPHEWAQYVPKVYTSTIIWPPRPEPEELPPTWLEQAKKVTEESRQLEYDHPVINFIRTGINWSMWLQGRKGFPIVINPIDVAWMMNGMKFAREINVHKDDNPIDTIGYLACHDRIDRYMKKIGYPEGAEVFESMTIGELADLMQKLTLEAIED